jgi:hypothetical protein
MRWLGLFSSVPRMLEMLVSIFSTKKVFMMFVVIGLINVEI